MSDKTLYRIGDGVRERVSRRVLLVGRYLGENEYRCLYVDADEGNRELPVMRTVDVSEGEIEYLGDPNECGSKECHMPMRPGFYTCYQHTGALKTEEA